MKDFELSSGTVTGSDHARSGHNNQDSFATIEDDGCIVAVVCDGCSSGEGGASGNELGARIGARLVARELWRHAASGRRLTHAEWELSRERVLAGLESIAYRVTATRAEFREFVLDNLLFTIVAAVVAREQSQFAAIGDGSIYVNGDRFALGPFEKNAPPYAAYSLLGSGAGRDQLAFSIVADMPTDDLRSFLVGSDGMDGLVNAAHETLPNGKQIGPIEDLWQADRFFKNPDEMRRHLVLAAGGIERRRRSFVRDDATAIVGRRRHG